MTNDVSFTATGTSATASAGSGSASAHPGSTGPDRGRTVTASIGPVDDLPVGSMRAATVEGRRVVVARTESGVHVLDNACPHQGYGLATGSFDGESVTCQWHNWKFRVADGVCVMGEENVARHRVEVAAGEAIVSISVPTAAEERDRLWPSLGSAVDRDYRGQMARDTARLLANGATPVDIVGRMLARAVPATEEGVDHETAMAADALSMALDPALGFSDGLDATLPVVQALSGLAEVTRGRPRRSPGGGYGGPIDAETFAGAVETEDVDRAMALVDAALAAGASPRDLRPWFIAAAGTHHLSYGHGAIYTQKVFELIDVVSPEVAPVLLAELAHSLITSTREDLLPYMAKTRRALDQVELQRLVAVDVDPRWNGRDRLIEELVDGEDTPMAAVARVLADGAGAEAVLDGVVLAGSHRLLRHRLDVEFDDDSDFGWLDVTHVLTYAHAARWAWRVNPSLDSLRLVFFAAWLAHDSGRAERRFGADTWSRPLSPTWSDPTELVSAIEDRRADDAVALALAGDRGEVATVLQQSSLRDGAGSFIVTAHLIKLARCVAIESATVGDSLPLAAAARFMAAPRRERFVADNVAEAVAFVRSGKPPKR